MNSFVCKIPCSNGIMNRTKPAVTGPSTGTATGTNIYNINFSNSNDFEIRFDNSETSNSDRKESGESKSIIPGNYKLLWQLERATGLLYFHFEKKVIEKEGLKRNWGSPLPICDTYIFWRYLFFFYSEYQYIFVLILCLVNSINCCVWGIFNLKCIIIEIAYQIWVWLNFVYQKSLTLAFKTSFWLQKNHLNLLRNSQRLFFF